MKNSQEYEDAFRQAVVNNRGDFAVKDIKLEDIYGANYQDQVFGKTRIGSKNNPIGTNETDFTDGTIKAIYQKDASGNWKLETMYPEPK